MSMTDEEIEKFYEQMILRIKGDNKISREYISDSFKNFFIDELTSRFYKFKEKIEILEKEEKKFISDLSNYRHFKGEKLSDEISEKMAKSPMCITLPVIKRLDKFSMINIILLREKLLFDIINKFNESLKYNDREVFKSLRNRIKDLESYLLDKSRAYKELKQQKKRNKQLRGEIKKMQTKINIQNLRIRKLELKRKVEI